MDSKVYGGFTDIHTHLFPAVDDGAADLQTTLELARLALENGTGKIFLTPHFGGNFKSRSPEWYREAFQSVRDVVQKRYPELKLYLGSEIAFEIDVPELLSEGKLLTMNGSEYVLLELHTGMNERSIVNAVYETVRCGFTPILAHVERFEVFRKKKELTDKVIDNGALIQLNAESVMGKNGFLVKKFCHKLLNENKVQFIASDAHNTTKRPPMLRQCYKMVAKEYGAKTANKLFSQNARVFFAEEKESEKI